MNFNKCTMTPAERIVNKCAGLYAQYGYRRFMMNKFEDYALYAENKNFLVDGRLLTFTDGGKLKALKPDITLSIVKNLAKEDQLPLKVFYNETVYRVKKGENEFSELGQMGLELIGDDSLYATAEVISLAKASLEAISQDSILDISHMGILSQLIDQACACGIDRAELIKLITQKNAEGIREYLNRHNCPCTLASLVGAYSPLSDMIPILNDTLPNSVEVAELSEISAVLAMSGLDQNVYLDFSLMHDIGYYNGIIFKGYVKDVPVAVLSGGRYDPLLDRFGLSCAAIGFAIYLDYIRHSEPVSETDVLLLFSTQDSTQSVVLATQMLTEQGFSVMAASQIPTNRSFARTMQVKEVLRS